jgi:AcrR family transcriptional regulator
VEQNGSLWMRPERNRRGPDPAYSREQITAAAIKIADAEGIEALSIRRVAREVGAGAMSLYRYIDSKDDLIELMVDAVEGEDPVPAKPSGDWRADLRELAEREHAMTRRHPWLTTRVTSRPSFGPNTLRTFEYGLSCIDGLGFSIDEMLAVAISVTGYVRTFVQGELAEAELRRRTKLTEEEWRLSQAPYLQKLIESGKYPLFTKVILDAELPHMNPERRFRTGLDHLLDGISAQLERKH